jgi:multidrug transporter EmrE-like cation transporter
MSRRGFQDGRFGADSRAAFSHIDRMKWVQMGFYVLLFSAGTILSSIAFKYAADSAGRKSLGYFIFGNIIGVLGPIALTLALRVSNPNITYALCYGTAFAALQLVAWRLFQQTLSPWQVVGIACVGVGICLMHVGARS